jgi:hypothetical protein
MPPVDVQEAVRETDGLSSGDEPDEAIDPLRLLPDPDVEAGTPIGKAGLNEGELALYLLDWMQSHKITDSAAKDIWGLLVGILPQNCDMQTFYAVKEKLRHHQLQAMQVIEICPNDCIAYWNSSHLPKVALFLMFA